ncbi:MAG: helix-turn-helix transcriptional regulator [Acidobacteria bacterium]|nr:helix-turn-helix transcriptional regulator [Acidobacteriota bacterium]
MAVQTGTPPQARTLASGADWSISEVVCGAGPHDRPFEEQHGVTSIAVVVSGTFQYRSPCGDDLMTPGSLLLGNAGDCFCCRHEHGTGDRCIAFAYEPARFEQIAESGARFHLPRLPAVRATAPLVTKAAAFLAGARGVSPEELSVQMAAETAQLAAGFERQRTAAEPSSLARVSRVIRMIDAAEGGSLDLTALSGIARLSPYHFLRVFEAITGTTPHQYVLRSRLRQAAVRLRTQRAPVLDIAFDCGFGDVSNFNRAFRAEFGLSPRAFRKQG